MRSVLAGWVAMATLLAAPTGLAAHEPAANHELWVLNWGPDGLVLRRRIEVPQPLPRARRKQPTRRALRYEVRDAAGHVLWAASIDDPRWVRGVFENANGTTSHVRVRDPHPVGFSLRLPPLPTARSLLLFDNTGSPKAHPKPLASCTVTTTKAQP